ncbi:hypothetical protein, partial [Mesorhizobium australafricanum]
MTLVETLRAELLIWSVPMEPASDLMWWTASARGIAMCQSVAVESHKVKAVHGEDYHNWPGYRQACLSGSR